MVNARRARRREQILRTRDAERRRIEANQEQDPYENLNDERVLSHHPGDSDEQQQQETPDVTVFYMMDRFQAFGRTYELSASPTIPHQQHDVVAHNYLRFNDYILDDVDNDVDTPSLPQLLIHPLSHVPINEMDGYVHTDNGMNSRENDHPSNVPQQHGNNAFAQNTHASTHDVCINCDVRRRQLYAYLLCDDRQRADILYVDGANSRRVFKYPPPEDLQDEIDNDNYDVWTDIKGELNPIVTVRPVHRNAPLHHGAPHSLEIIHWLHANYISCFQAYSLNEKHNSMFQDQEVPSAVTYHGHTNGLTLTAAFQPPCRVLRNETVCAETAQDVDWRSNFDRPMSRSSSPTVSAYCTACDLSQSNHHAPSDRHENLPYEAESSVQVNPSTFNDKKDGAYKRKRKETHTDSTTRTNTRLYSAGNRHSDSHSRTERTNRRKMKKRAKQTQPPGQSHMSVFRLDGNTNRAAHSSNSNNNQSTVNSSLPFRHVDPAVGIEGMNQGCQSKKSAEIDDGENTCSSCNNTSHTVSRCNGTVSDVDSPSSGEDGIRNFDPRGQRRTAVYDSNHILRKMNVRSTNGTGTHGSRPRRIREPIASRTRSQRKKNEANSVVLK